MTFVPDFFIVGAPKCGTTAMHRYLGQHPSIAMSTRKEPTFWAHDVDAVGPLREAAAYRALWEGAPQDALLGEASTGYLRSREGIPAIMARRPEALFIAMIRNPSEMAHALHAQLLRTDQEDVSSFRKAWALQDSRAVGLRIPPKCSAPELLQYRQVCSLGDQLERFCALVPVCQRLIILFDDFVADTRNAYNQVLSFLRVPPDDRQSFERINPTQGFRFPRLAAGHRTMPQWLGPMYRPLRALAVRLRISPSRVMARFNGMAPRQLPELSPRFKTELKAVFEPQIEKIEELLSRDLSHWKGPVDQRPGGSLFVGNAYRY